jgi:hypothetical protein
MHQADTTHCKVESTSEGGGAYSKGMRKRGRLGNTLQVSVNTLEWPGAGGTALECAKRHRTDKIRGEQEDVLLGFLFPKS